MIVLPQYHQASGSVSAQYHASLLDKQLTGQLILTPAFAFQWPTTAGIDEESLRRIPVEVGIKTGKNTFDDILHKELQFVYIKLTRFLWCNKCLLYLEIDTIKGESCSRSQPFLEGTVGADMITKVLLRGCDAKCDPEAPTSIGKIFTMPF